MYQAANMNVNDMMGTPIDMLRDSNQNRYDGEQESNINYDRMQQLQQMQEFMNHSGNVNNIGDLTQNINQDLDDIDNYTPDDTQIRLQQIHKLQQMQEMENLKNRTSEDNSKQVVKKHRKKRKQNKLLKNCISNLHSVGIEVIILVLIYYIMSTKTIRVFITKYIGINVESDVKVGGIISYGFMLAIMFVIIRCVVNFVKDKIKDIDM